MTRPRAATRNGNGPPLFFRSPALPHLESRRASHSRACYRPHSHPTLSIGAVDGGASVFSGAGTGPVLLRPGSVVWIPAECVHACNPLPGRDWSYQMLHVELDWLRAQQPELAAMAGNARSSDDPALHAHYCAMNTLLFSAATPAAKNEAVLAFLRAFALAEATPLPSVPVKGRVDPRLPALLDWLQHAARQDVPLDELAARAGMGRYQLIRAFRNATGMAPRAWQLNRRINASRRLLRDGRSLAAIAQDQGFADQAHFQRMFKAHTGTTPGHYRR